MSKKWMSPKPIECDLCRMPLVGKFIDGKTTFGPWGIMCLTCHRTLGVGLGTGKGQLYSLETLEKLEG